MKEKLGGKRKCVYMCVCVCLGGGFKEEGVLQEVWEWKEVNWQELLVWKEKRIVGAGFKKQGEEVMG
jgi:hypothetical protein